jgi:protoporphyrinogen/coproporphyrinogen III oxidase
LISGEEAVRGMSSGSVAVVGAGLSGLTAAYRLQQAGWDVTVLESTDVVGGRVRTEEINGFKLDTGATGLAESYEAYFALAAELGIRGDIIPAAPYIGIYRDGRIHLLRLDRMARTGVTTRLLSWRAKARAARLGFDVARAKFRGQLDYSDMRKAAPLDVESAAQYADRALDRELGQYLCEPVARMMMIADAEDVSVVELFSGLANIFASRICSLRGGQGRLPRLLAERVGVKLSSRVESVVEVEDGVEVSWRADGAVRTERFDACVISCPLPVAAAICPGRENVLGPLNGALDYTQCVSVAVATRRPPASPAMVVEMPPSEDPCVALMFLDHNKNPDRVPAGRGLIGCCWEARASTSHFEAPDDALVERTLQSVFRVFPELRGQVEFTHVTRWAAALPHTRIGAYKLIGELNARIDPQSRIQFAADYMSAAGQNTAVEFGTRAAENLDTTRRRGGFSAAPAPVVSGR